MEYSGIVYLKSHEQARTAHFDLNTMTETYQAFAEIQVCSPTPVYIALAQLLFSLSSFPFAALRGKHSADGLS